MNLTLGIPNYRFVDAEPSQFWHSSFYTTKFILQSYIFGIWHIFCVMTISRWYDRQAISRTLEYKFIEMTNNIIIFAKFWSKRYTPTSYFLNNLFAHAFT